MDFGFVIPVADEGVIQLEACLGFLRGAYPKAPIRVISDGVHDPAYKPCCERHGAVYAFGAYLKRTECGGAWWRRILETGLQMGTRWIVKLDPDARVWRPFVGFPRYQIAGTKINDGSEMEHVQGGCQLISATAARQIVVSDLPEDPTLRLAKTMAPNEWTCRDWRASAYLCSDQMLARFARNLGIAQGDWPEVGSRWKEPLTNPELKYAVTHPHKLDRVKKYHDANLRVITTCRDRLDHLKKTLPSWAAEPNVDLTVVDYGCSQGTSDWVRTNYPGAIVVQAKDVPTFNLSRARNLGAANSPPGWWCFFDADFYCTAGWADDIRNSLRENCYHLVQPIDWGMLGSCVVHSDAFHLVGGYDSLFTSWGAEDDDFYARLRQVGVRPARFPRKHFEGLQHGDAQRMANYRTKDKDLSRRVLGLYAERKQQFMMVAGKLPTRKECAEILLEICIEFGIEPGSTFYPVIEIDIEVEIFIGNEAQTPARPQAARKIRHDQAASPSGPHLPHWPDNGGVPETPAPPPPERPSLPGPDVTRDAPKAPDVPARSRENPPAPAEPAIDITPRVPFAPDVPAVPGLPGAIPAPAAGLQGPSGKGGPSGAHGPAPVSRPRVPAGTSPGPGEPLLIRPGVPAIIVPSKSAPWTPGGVPITTEEVTPMSPSIHIAVVNEATVNLGLDLRTLCKLGMAYIQQVVLPHWPGRSAILVPSKELLPNAPAIVLMDDADQQDALGYHDVTPDGFPIAKIFARMSLADGATVTEVFTHELAEMLVDPDCNLTATNANGLVYALECADPVEEDLLTVNGYPVSNIVTPAWFESFHKPGSQRFDHLAHCTAPFQLLSGGYAVVTDSQGNTKEIFGSVEKGFRFSAEDRRFHRAELRKTRQHYARGKMSPRYVAAGLGRRPVLTHA